MSQMSNAGCRWQTTGILQGSLYAAPAGAAAEHLLSAEPNGGEHHFTSLDVSVCGMSCVEDAPSPLGLCTSKSSLARPVPCVAC